MHISKHIFTIFIVEVPDVVNLSFNVLTDYFKSLDFNDNNEGSGNSKCNDNMSATYSSNNNHSHRNKETGIDAFRESNNPLRFKSNGLHVVNLNIHV